MKRIKEPDAESIVARFVLKVEKLESRRRPVYAAIDPGVGGAVALVCGNTYAAFDIPTIKINRGKKNEKAFDLNQILHLFRFLRIGLHRDRKDIMYAAVEKAQVGIPGKGNSAYNGFRVGCGYYMWPLFLLSMGFRVEEIRPSIWKKAMGLQGKDKESSRHKAQQMFPRASLFRKKDHDRAEALLIAEWMRRTRSPKRRKR